MHKSSIQPNTHINAKSHGHAYEHGPKYFTVIYEREPLTFYDAHACMYV